MDRNLSRQDAEQKKDKPKRYTERKSKRDNRKYYRGVKVGQYKLKSGRGMCRAHLLDIIWLTGLYLSGGEYAYH